MTNVTNGKAEQQEREGERVGALVVALPRDDFRSAIHLSAHHRHRGRIIAFGRISAGFLGVKGRALAKVGNLYLPRIVL